MNLITAPFAWIMRTFYSLTGSYGLSLILFSLVVKLVMLPFQIKSKKSMVRMGRLSSKQLELQKKYANNQMKYQEELQKLYTEAGVNPMSGCLWSLLPMAIIIPLYSIVRQPITALMRLSTESYHAIRDLAVSLGHTLGTGTSTAYEQIGVAQFVSDNWTQFQGKFDGLMPVDFRFLGIDLTLRPTAGFTDFAFDWATIGLILIPILSGVFSWLLSKVTASSNGQTETQASMKGMMLMMPLMSVYIGFTLPASLGLYWIANTLFSILQESTLGRYFNKKIQAEEDEREAKREAARKLRMEEAKRQAAEMRENPEYQKKKAKKEAAAPVEKKNPTSEAGRIEGRPYARGRSYVADRYDKQ